jgi:hypothetical protein
MVARHRRLKSAAWSANLEAADFQSAGLPDIGVTEHETNWGNAMIMIAPDQRHPNGRKVRSDALPEHVEYRDAGCELAPCCVRCPLVRCRYDEPGGARALRQGSRDEAVRCRREEGVGIDALAAEFGLSRRSVFRILARGQAARQHARAPAPLIRR